eukprot:1157832-Pelagomonas_calceolata.AAC.4
MYVAKRVRLALSKPRSDSPDQALPSPPSRSCSQAAAPQPPDLSLRIEAVCACLCALCRSQPGKDEVANGFAQGVIRDAAVEESGILDSLLGPEQAKAALDTIATNKNWQGNLTAYCQPRLRTITEGGGSGTCSTDSPPKPLTPTPQEPTAPAPEQSVPGVSPWDVRLPSNTEQVRKSPQQLQPQVPLPLRAPSPDDRPPQVLPTHDTSEVLQTRQPPRLLQTRGPSKQQLQQQSQERCAFGEGNSAEDLVAPLPRPSSLNTFTKRGSCPGFAFRSGSNYTPSEQGLERQLSDNVQRGFQAGSVDFGTRSSASGGKASHRDSGKGYRYRIRDSLGRGAGCRLQLPVFSLDVHAPAPCRGRSCFQQGPGLVPHAGSHGAPEVSFVLCVCARMQLHQHALCCLHGINSTLSELPHPWPEMLAWVPAQINYHCSALASVMSISVAHWGVSFWCSPCTCHPPCRLATVLVHCALHD